MLERLVRRWISAPPSRAVWDRLSDEERRRVVDSLPSDIERATPPEGDLHRLAKARAFEALGGLDLVLGEGRLRFFHGSAPFLDARELIGRLATMIDDAVRRAEDEARRADKLAARLRELGVDPDAID